MVRGRDFIPNGEIGAVLVRDGDHCARCGQILEIARGIELGHVFQLGRKYSQAFGLAVTAASCKPVTVAMGSDGIGITRAVAALAEQTHDHLGLRWPRQSAPAHVHLVATGKGSEPYQGAESLAAALVEQGLSVLYDDRVDSSPGVKFADAELLGIPLIVTVGRGLPTEWSRCATAGPTSAAKCGWSPRRMRSPKGRRRSGNRSGWTEAPLSCAVGR